MNCLLAISLSNLTRHKLRTFLSVLAITIGVASLIALVSIVDGIRADISDAFSSAQGARVTPLNSSDPIFNSLDESWVDKIESVQGVEYALPTIIQAAREIEDKPGGYGAGARIVGVAVSKQSKAESSGFDGELLEGRDFLPSDTGKKIALIGKSVKDDNDKFLGSKIKVNDESLRIVGVYTTGSSLLDNTILVPIDVARDITGFPADKVSFINVTFDSLNEDQLVVDRINLIYGDDVKATSLNDFSAQFGAIFDSVTALVGVIASVASIVASVVVINTVLMSVLERFKEIGALKAVGWSNDDIIQMVLYESALIGVFGGILGVILGFISAGIISYFGLTTVVTNELVIGSFIGAIFVGALSGIYPAFIASRMDPIEALHTE